ncbi:hypothetical protein PGT21_035008 [Puccinia graminis f. sp. tritici]|uniref:Uncharacterized protein n=1 Tax=Puccinia graminis f. sp. tritici TaxID=56615 RepID=A0A5B0NVT8_PUCGR|nr:hypothetical protein PGT21_035008 [Puccinia graminis f. sp. tritici]KAA1091978.1 hypothetical protein PGTUg99_005218 [Puccinia graminis f. sp. tritici]
MTWRKEDKPSASPIAATAGSPEPSLVDLATCHTSSADDSHRSQRAASPKSSTMMSTSPSHRRMEPFIRPPPMMKDELITLAIPDVMKPDAYRIPPRRDTLCSTAGSTFNSKNLHRFNRISHPSLLKRVKDKVLHRSASQRSKHTHDHQEIPCGTSLADLDWLPQHICTSSHKSSAAYLSESKLTMIERWRIAVYLSDLLRGI